MPLSSLSRALYALLSGDNAKLVLRVFLKRHKRGVNMAAESSGEVKMVPTLGLTGVTINAMALIAPGAFLWTTFASQSTTGATEMWFSVFVAIIIALFTAISYSALAK